MKKDLLKLKYPDPDLVKKVFTKPDYLLAFGFGSGLAPIAPGTFGTLVGVLIWYLCQPAGLIAYLSITLAVTLLGIWISDRVARDMVVKDPGGIVIDEIAGVMIAFILIPAHPVWWLAGFLVFRFFDIVKPWPASWCDQKLEGGLGVMLDDVVAGLYTLIVIQLAYFWLPEGIL